MKNNIKNIIRTLICFSMAAMLALSMFSCSNKEEADGPRDGEAAVVRVSVALKKGDLISEDKVKIDYIKAENIPLNAVRTLEEVIGKYASADLVVGDYIFRSKLAATLEEIFIPEGEAFISVKDIIDTSADCTEAIQKLIDENPGRTLYFADGTYTISNSLRISAHPDEKVSFEMSDFAVLKASDSWQGGEGPLIRIGATNADIDHDEVGSTNANIKGGILDGNGCAPGISVDGGRDSAITNVTIKNATTGIVLGNRTGTEARTVVENVDIVGIDGKSSTGIEILSDGNELDIVQIDNCTIGVNISGKNNILRNTHVTYDSTDLTATGFYDMGENNSYDFCFAENCSTGFYMRETVKGSVYTSCYAFWTNGLAKQTAFESAGKFNAVVRTCRTDFVNADADTALLKVGAEGGEGKILWPVVKNVANIDDTTYTAYLGGTTVTEMME